MEGITLGQIFSTLGAIAGAFTAIGVIMTTMRKWNAKSLNDVINPLIDKINSIDKNVCKNYIIEYLGEEKRGVKHTETETRLFWDNYDRYIACGGNSYVKEEVEKLRNKQTKKRK